MSRLCKKYPCGQKRGGTPGKPTQTDSVTTGKTRKSYDVQIKSCHGGAMKEVMDVLHQDLKRRGLSI